MLPDPSFTILTPVKAAADVGVPERIDCEAPSDGDETADGASPTDRLVKQRQRRPMFYRGGGAIRTRSHGGRNGVAQAAKRGTNDPSNHKDAMAKDALGWSTSELAENGNLEPEEY